jgi:hypothetical protein
MTQFNPLNKESLTYGECLDPAMKITDSEDAIQYKKAYMMFIEKSLKDGQSESGLTAEQIANVNLGYYAGYYSDEVRKRVEKLFMCSHPIFGSIKENGIPTAKESYECGISSKTLNEIRKP